MPQDQQTRDMAIEALSNISSHIKTCDRRYEEYANRQEKTLQYLEKLSNEINGMREVIAEAKGAGKVMKYLGHGLTIAGGGIAGFLTSGLKHL